jgi:hypothetical protein
VLEDPVDADGADAFLVEELIGGVQESLAGHGPIARRLCHTA